MLSNASFMISYPCSVSKFRNSSFFMDWPFQSLVERLSKCVWCIGIEKDLDLRRDVI